MKTLHIILIAVAILNGCYKKSASATVTNISIPGNNKTMNDSLNYLALGDSYTIGEAVGQGESFPYQLTLSLNSNLFTVNPPTIIATTGWTTGDLTDAISTSSIHGNKYDFVTLLIGVNDQYQQLSIDNYKLKFAEVLNTAISFAGGNTSRVFVLSIPDWGVTPFAAGQDSVIYPQIQAFNAVNESISKSAGVNYLNITDISRMAATKPSLVATDGLHPSGQMYAMWVKLLEPLVAGRLKK